MVSVEQTPMSWQQVGPIEYAWHNKTLAAPSPNGPFLSKWASKRLSGQPLTLFIPLAKPNLFRLLLYKSLGANGLPQQKPDPRACNRAESCELVACKHGDVPGTCVVVGDNGLAAYGALVIFCQWMIPGTTIAEAKEYGPVTDSASWGVKFIRSAVERHRSSVTGM